MPGFFWEYVKLGQGQRHTLSSVEVNKTILEKQWFVVRYCKEGYMDKSSQIYPIGYVQRAINIYINEI